MERNKSKFAKPMFRQTRLPLSKLCSVLYHCISCPRQSNKPLATPWEAIFPCDIKGGIRGLTRLTSFLSLSCPLRSMKSTFYAGALFPQAAISPLR